MRRFLVFSAANRWMRVECEDFLCDKVGLFFYSDEEGQRFQTASWAAGHWRFFCEVKGEWPDKENWPFICTHMEYIWGREGKDDMDADT